MRSTKKNLLTLVTVSAISIVTFQNCSPDFIAANFDSESLSSSASSSMKVRRVSNQEYKNSIRSIIEEQWSRRQPIANLDPNRYWWPPAVQGALSELPADSLYSKLGTDQLSTTLSSGRFSAYTDIAYALGKAIAADAVLRANFIGACATDENDVSNATCVDTFINEFGTIAFRTPPTATELSEIKTNAKNWRTLIARILLHPRFLVHYERDGVKDAAGNYKLTDYEIESRLTSVFWKSSPDLQGLANVASGKLKTQAGLQAEATRILNSQKTRDAMWVFYRQWFATTRLPAGGAYDTGAGFEGMAAPLTASQLNGNSFLNAVLEDGHQFLDYLTWTQPSTLETLFRSPLIFTTDPTLASIYGVSPRTDVNAPPITDTSGHYPGILTRAMITQQKPSVNGDINHIQRGVLILTNLLNMELGQPANFADQQQAQLVIPMTASTRTEIQTKTGSGSCIGCHTTINPAGYALANYDSLGRYITTERRFRDVNNSGVATQVASNPVDATAVLPLNGNAYSVSDATTLTDAFFKSGRIYQGFANYYFEYAFGRVPSSASDARIVNAIATNLQTKTIRATLEAIPLLPEFSMAMVGQ